MITDFPIQGILDHLVKRIVEILPVTAAGVTLISPGLEPHYVAASDDSALRHEQLQTELGEGHVWRLSTPTGQFSCPICISTSGSRGSEPRALESGLAAVFTFPLRHKGLRLGALDLYRETPATMSGESRDAAQTLADVATAYLVDAQHRDRILR
jgi:hypothetical protein